MTAHSDLTGLALVVLAAAVCGVAMTRFRQPAIVGYIIAGLLLGPSGLALVQDRAQIGDLAELGVLLLLFLIGMELSLRAFKQVWRTALIATGLQVAASLGLMFLLSFLFGWSLALSVLLGFVIALSSTAVVIKMLEEMNILRSPVAQITVGVLIAQDLAVVPMILTVNALAGADVAWAGAAKIAVSIVFLVLLILYLSRRKKVRLPFARLAAGHRDLTPLRGLAFCFGAAAATGFIGLSPAYGAFLAGLVIGNSTERPAMHRAIQPIQSILMMVFFLSIGLLIDIDFIMLNLAAVLLVLFVVTVFKTALNIGVLRIAGQPWAHAVITGILLAQIGEFSFILGQAGVGAGLVGEADMNLIVSVTALSLMVSPLWLLSARRLMRIAILSVTSGHEVVRLFFGRYAPWVFHAWERMRARTSTMERVSRTLHGERRPSGNERHEVLRPPPPEAENGGSRRGRGDTISAEVIAPAGSEAEAGGPHVTPAEIVEEDGEPETEKQRGRSGKDETRNGRRGRDGAHGRPGGKGEPGAAGEPGEAGRDGAAGARGGSGGRGGDGGRGGNA